VLGDGTRLFGVSLGGSLNSSLGRASSASGLASSNANHHVSPRAPHRISTNDGIQSQILSAGGPGSSALTRPLGNVPLSPGLQASGRTAALYTSPLALQASGAHLSGKRVVFAGWRAVLMLSGMPCLLRGSNYRLCAVLP
jgi:hypothetical protein